MNIVFTICSNNYLAQAKVLLNSVLIHNPEYKVVIVLVDRFNTEVNYNLFEPIEVIKVEEMGIEGFDLMVEKYDIVELNTAVKPTSFKYLRDKYRNCEHIIYLDPDIKVFSSMGLFNNLLNEYSILLTPHIYTPLAIDSLSPNEQTFQMHGIYNLGFLALNVKKQQALSLLDWWEERCLSICFRDTSKGLFVDQLWLNLAPSYYSETHILRHMGSNMGPWNLHERKLSKFNEEWVVNNSERLVFFHFSSYDFNKPENINKPFYNRYNFENRPDLKEVYTTYHKELIDNNVESYSSLNCMLYKPRKQDPMGEKKKINQIKHLFKRLTPPILFDSLVQIKNNIYAKV
jgi:lipopolysaccharide biosynthesis glycosyltransferase